MAANAGDLARTYATTLSCVGDIQASLEALLPTLERKLVNKRSAINGLRKAAELELTERRAELRETARMEYDAPVITPLVAAAEVVRAVGPNVAIVDEAAATFHHARSFVNSFSSRQNLFMRGAILGWGMPAAVGTSLGLDRQPVVALVGDGAALYSPQALWTAARESLPVTFVVMNNREYNILKRYMRDQSHYLRAHENRSIGMDIATPAIDFMALASSMGVPARRVQRAADIAEAVADGIASGLPNLIEVPISAP